jgi:hypothetical protein
MVFAGGLYSLQKLLCAVMFQKVKITDVLKQLLLPPSLGTKLHILLEILYIITADISGQ